MPALAQKDWSVEQTEFLGTPEISDPAVVSGSCLIMGSVGMADELAVRDIDIDICGVGFGFGA
jgi:hypothetical protein